MTMTVDLAQLTIAMGAVLTLFGTAFAWLFRTVSRWKRDTDAKLERCEAHHQVSDHRRMSQAKVIRHLIEALRRIAPDNPGIREAEDMLNEMDRQAREMLRRKGLSMPDVGEED